MKTRLLLLSTAIAAALGASAQSVSTVEYIARGNDFAWGRLELDGLTNSQIKEQGFCWATHNNPTLDDNHTKEYYSNQGRIFHMENLEPCTQYWARAYVITKEGETLYGQPVMFYTIQKGNIGYTLNISSAPDEPKQRLQEATEGAVDYWNRATSIQGYHITVNWSPGTPTADCSYGGWIRVGENAGNQKIGTLMHEMNHGVGVGQLSQWYGPNSPFRSSGSSGTWIGPRATDLIRFIDNDPTAYMKGDGTHMWPYGINGAHEDLGTEFLYRCNGLITQSLGEDGLPPVAKHFHQPSYSFPIDDNAVYYFRLMTDKRGGDTNFIHEVTGNELAWSAMTADEVLADKNAAWTLSFDPKSQMYLLKNVGTGNYMLIKNKTAKTSAEIEDRNYIQITKWVKKGKFNGEKYPTYVFSSSSDTEAPLTLSVNTSGELKNMSYNDFDTDNYQRWMLLTANEVAQASAGVNAVYDRNPDAPANVYDISGRVVKYDATDLEGLDKGLYIFKGRKIRK